MREVRFQVPTRHGPVWVVAVAETNKQARRDARKTAEYVIRGIPILGLKMRLPDGTLAEVRGVDRSRRRVRFGDGREFHWSEVRYA